MMVRFEDYSVAKLSLSLQRQKFFQYLSDSEKDEPHPLMHQRVATPHKVNLQPFQPATCNLPLATLKVNLQLATCNL